MCEGHIAMNDVGNPNNDTYPPPPDRRRPTNGDILARIEAVEEKIDHVLFALGVDNPADPNAWRKLGQEHSLVRTQRSFCEKVGWNVVWLVVAFVGLVGLSNLEHLRKLAGIK